MNQEQIKRLLTDLFTDDQTVDEPLCHANQADIVTYIEAELEQSNAAVRYPALQRQLDSCASCRTVYTELKDLLTLERAEQLVEPPSATFDLSFLQQPAQQTVPAISTAAVAGKPRTDRQPADSIRWRLNELGQMIIALSTEFLATIQPSPQLTYQKAPVRDLFTVTSPAIADDLTVTVAARTMRRHPEQCVITITADIPSRGGWPYLGGTAVTLAIAGEVAAMRNTDSFGNVIFEGIAQAHLSQVSIAVEPLR